MKMIQEFKEIEHKKVRFIDTKKNEISEDAFTRYSFKDKAGKKYYVFSIGENSNVFFIKEYLDDPKLPEELQYRPFFNEDLRKEVYLRLLKNRYMPPEG